MARSRRLVTLGLLVLLAACGGGGGAGADGADDALPATTLSTFVDGALVHSILAGERTRDVALILVPGANLSSYIYVATPDGRPGWAWQFAAAGYDVHIVNDPGFDWSRGFPVAPFEVPAEGAPAADPEAVRAWSRDIWRRWGFGESEGVPYDDTRFPTEDFAAFERGYPYIAGGGASYSDVIQKVLEDVGPAVILAHSAGGPRALTVALARPDLVPVLVLVEPTGPPDEDDFPALAGLSLFGVYGDYIDSRNQGNRKSGTEAAAALFAANGGVGEVVSLPEDLEITGNTHLMMQDDNSAFIGGLILDWLDRTLGRD